MILNNDQDKKLKILTFSIYLLQGCHLLLGMPLLIAVIVNYLKQDDVKDTWYASHFRWQIRTFWFAMLWGALGFILIIVLVGYLILALNSIWIIYRVIKGFLYLSDGKPMYS